LAVKNYNEIAKKAFVDYGLKESSAEVYACVLGLFCEFAEVSDAYALTKLGLDRIETLLQKWITRNRDKLAPKRLNLTYCAVKRWCQIEGLIKSTKLFREIRFDRTSRKTRDRAMLTKNIVKKMFDNADLREKIVVGFYGINALRPSLIPQILIEDIYGEDIKISDNSVKLAEKTWIWVKREYKGNKGNIDFPIITSAEESVWLEQYLNNRIRKGEKFTPKSQIVLVNNKDAVDYIVKKLFELVGFKGRNYLLRHFAYKRLKNACEDYDLREWLMGHRGKVSAVYDHEHYLTHEEIEEYKVMINSEALHIYGFSRSQQALIETRIDTIKALCDLDTNQIEALKKELASGKIIIQTFNDKLTELAQNAMNKQIETRFEELFIEMNKRYNSHST